jgi:NAD(P)-dependent dehydrogenase (short-subunit alcohol dehydrogenase family)
VEQQRGDSSVNALALISAGAKVVVSGRREEEGCAVEWAIKRAGGDALFVKADVGWEADVKALVDKLWLFSGIYSKNLRQTVSSAEEYRHQNSWKTGGLFHLKSRIVLMTGNTPRTKPIKVMNTIGTQVSMANGISRKKFLVNSAGFARTVTPGFN